MRWLPTALLFTIPFTFSGLMIGALLSNPDLPAPRVYAFDLAGSALGAFAVIPAIRQPRGRGEHPTGLRLLLAGTVALAPPRRATARVAAVVSAVALAGTALDRDQVYVMVPRTGRGARPEEQILGPPYGVEYIHWEPGGTDRGLTNSAPDTDRVQLPVAGGRRTAPPRAVRRILTQNDYAFTFMVDSGRAPPSPCGGSSGRSTPPRTRRPHRASSPRVLVVGVGGGFDILTALRYEAREVTGVEINSATLDIVTRVYRDSCGSWSARPARAVDRRTRGVTTSRRALTATTSSRLGGQLLQQHPRLPRTCTPRATSTPPRPSTSTSRA